MGSQLALCSVLRRMGKEAIPCSAGPFKRSEISKFGQLFISDPVEKDGDRVILVDCSSPDRSGNLENLIEKLPMALIDHHEAGQYSRTESPAGAPVLIDKNAPSTTFLVLKLIEALGLTPTKEEAELLFLGLSTDTGFFRHVDDSGAAAFEAAASLIRYGANPKAAFAAINGGKSLDSRRLIGQMLLSAESHFDGKLILCSEDYEQASRFGPESRDSDSLYQLLQALAGVEAIVVMRQETGDKFSIGFRSRDWVDVGEIAESFGGGGHKNAAGCSLAGTISEYRPKILKIFEEVFNNTKT
ncbi:MAG: bifunctional oligoribonuclease/PAP phosphatase NrnA [Treponema sp.]|nr:bifunctional oligoribonuclease/PAP phosphatase NrnA [Treponema sp.]